MYAQQAQRSTPSYFASSKPYQPDETELPLPDTAYAGVGGPIDPGDAMLAFGHLTSATTTASS